MTNKQNSIAIVAVILLLIAFLLYYFFVVRKPKKETCPDGSDIPESGNCADNQTSNNTGTGTNINIPKPDLSGCVQPSSYVQNTFPLTLGMRGDIVAHLQMALNRDFRAGLKEDGFFGCKTQSALEKAIGSKRVQNKYEFEDTFGKLSVSLPLQG